MKGERAGVLIIARSTLPEIKVVSLNLDTLPTPNLGT